MHLSNPRVTPRPESEWNDKTNELLESLRRDGHTSSRLSLGIRSF